jgi:hypothetical protein
MNTSFRMGSSPNVGNDRNYSFIGKLNTNVAPFGLSVSDLRKALDATVHRVKKLNNPLFIIRR